MLVGVVTASLVYYAFQRSLHRMTETYKPYQPDAPHMYIPVMVCWLEILLMLILSFGYNAHTDTF